MQRYESYKPSGVKWLGDVPAHWHLKKNKFLWREKEDRSLLGIEELLSVSQYSGVVPRTEDSRSESLEDYKRCEPNDLVINIMLAWMSGLGISKYSGIVSPAYCVYRQLEDHNPAYFDYLYRTPQYLAEFARRSKGIVPSRWRMYTEDFGQILSLLPPREEQDRIVVFLDQKTAEIDAAIAKKERLIELLEESLSIHIAHAVTQGLNLNTPVINSGCPWLGSIPSNWRPMKLTWVCSSIRDGTHNPPPETDSEYRLLSVRNIITGEFVIRDDDRTMSLPAFKALTRSYTVQRGDVVLALVGGTTGKSAVVEIDCENISVQRSLGILRPIRSKVLPEFLNFSLKAKGIQRRIWDIATKYAAQPGIYLEDVGNLKIAVPQISEQELIIRYCNDVQDKTFKTVMSVTREIQSLRELKQSLIFDGVSGKIKI